MLKYILSSGIFGLAIILTGITLLAVAIVMLYASRQRKPFVILAIISSLPLLLGWTGTMIGNLSIDARIHKIDASGHKIDERARAAIVQHGRKEAQAPMHMGATVSLLLLGLSLAGAGTRGRQPD